MKRIEIPTGLLSIAVHVRKEERRDLPLLSGHRRIKGRMYGDVKRPFKFPSDQYYIDQIIELSKVFNDQPIYVHIFTDAKDPGKLVEK